MAKKRSFKMTEEEYLEYDDRMIGLCTKCGAERECCEPDACEYDCPECGAMAVYGVPELMLMGLVEIVQ